MALERLPPRYLFIDRRHSSDASTYEIRDSANEIGSFWIRFAECPAAAGVD